MNIEEFEELLEEAFPNNSFLIETDNNGQLVIYSGLQQDDDGELIEYEDEDDDEDDEEDEDADPDLEPLADED